MNVNAHAHAYVRVLVFEHPDIRNDLQERMGGTLDTRGPRLSRLSISHVGQRLLNTYTRATTDQTDLAIPVLVVNILLHDLGTWSSWHRQTSLDIPAFDGLEVNGGCQQLGFSLRTNSLCGLHNWGYTCSGKVTNSHNSLRLPRKLHLLCTQLCLVITGACASQRGGSKIPERSPHISAQTHDIMDALATSAHRFGLPLTSCAPSACFLASMVPDRQSQKRRPWNAP